MTVKLHIGAGTSVLAGWINLDIAPYPGVDAIVDVREGLPYTDVSYIFAEHFIEHLRLEEGLRFMRECRRVLREDGILRLSTPNLDWVWLTHYKAPDEFIGDEALIGCLEINRAFHGWGHQFLYNETTITGALRSAGFAHVESRAYGESATRDLQGLERHERHQDLPDAPSVIVVEASGIRSTDEAFGRMIDPYVRDAVVT